MKSAPKSALAKKYEQQASSGKNNLDSVYKSLIIDANMERGTRLTKKDHSIAIYSKEIGIF